MIIKIKIIIITIIIIVKIIIIITTTTRTIIILKEANHAGSFAVAFKSDYAPAGVRVRRCLVCILILTTNNIKN